MPFRPVRDEARVLPHCDSSFPDACNRPSTSCLERPRSWRLFAIELSDDDVVGNSLEQIHQTSSPLRKVDLVLGDHRVGRGNPSATEQRSEPRGCVAAHLWRHVAI